MNKYVWEKVSLKEQVECKKCRSLFSEGWEIKIIYGGLSGIEREPIEKYHICFPCASNKKVL